MANLRDIQRRIKSVKNTGKITRAMQLVAASKMKKAQDSAIASRPYAQLLAEMLKAIQASLMDEEVSHPMLKSCEVTKKRGILVISTDKGLCGGLNANLFRKLIELPKANCRFYAVGRKASQFLARTGRELKADFTLPDSARFVETRALLEMLISDFLEGEIDSIEVLYSRFVNNLKQEPSLVQIAPIKDLDKMIEDIQSIHDYTSQAPIENDVREIKFEPSSAAILDSILPLFVKREIYHKILEAKASEHSARMVAMKTATDNAKELVDKLTLQFNKARQAAITQEILELSAASVSH